MEDPRPGNPSPRCRARGVAGRGLPSANQAITYLPDDPLLDGVGDERYTGHPAALDTFSRDRVDAVFIPGDTSHCVMPTTQLFGHFQELVDAATP